MALASGLSWDIPADELTFHAGDAPPADHPQLHQFLWDSQYRSTFHVDNTENITIYFPSFQQRIYYVLWNKGEPTWVSDTHIGLESDTLTVHLPHKLTMR